MAASELAIVIRAKDEFSREFGKAGRSAGGLGNTMKNVLRAGALAGGAALAGAGVLALKFGSDFDSAFNTIRIGTGATGDALEGLKGDFKETFRGVPDSMATVATATADLNTRLGLTGPPLQQMTRQFLDLARITGTDVATAIAAGTRAFGDWSIATKEQSGAMDFLFKVSQTTGIGIDKLMTQIVTFGAPLRQMGFDFEQAAILTAKWEKEGVNAEAIFGALKIGVANFAKAGIPANEGLRAFIEEIQRLGPSAEATTLAIEVFGSRAGPDMVAAVLEGRFAIEDLEATVAASGETIAAAAEDTLRWQDKLAILKNTILVKLEPVLTGLVDKLGEFSNWLIEVGLPMTEEFVEQLREELRPAVEFLKDAFEFLRPKIEAVGRIIIRLIRFLDDHREILLAVAIAIAIVLVPAFVAWAVAAGAAAVATIAATLPVIAIIAAIALLVLGIILLVKHWDEVTAFLKGAWDTATSFIVEKALWLKDQIVEKFEALKDGAIGKLTALLIWIAGLPRRILNALGDVKGTLAGKGADLLIGLGAGIAFVWLAVKSFYVNLPGNILRAIGNVSRLLFNKGKELIRGFIDGIRSLRIPNPLDLIPGGGIVGGIVGGFRDLVDFAHGGVVPGPIGAPRLAVVHGGEQVIPARSEASAPTVQNFYINNITIEGDPIEALGSLGVSLP